MSLRLPHACHDQRDSMGGLETSILPVAIRGCFPLLDFMDWFRGTSTGNQSFYRFLKCQLFKKKKGFAADCPMIHCWDATVGQIGILLHSSSQFFSVKPPSSSRQTVGRIPPFFYTMVPLPGLQIFAASIPFLVGEIPMIGWWNLVFGRSTPMFGWWIHVFFFW